MAAANTLRSPAAVTIAVWHALFLREAVARISSSRTAWLWVLLEPAFHIALLMFLFSTIRLRVIGGIDTALWIMVGLLVFFMFRRPAQRAMNSIFANRALFSYRQVKPVDVVLVRAAVEGFLMIAISCLVLTGAGLYGISVFPADPLRVLAAFVGMWMCGLGFGLATSVAEEVLETGRFVQVLMQPLYFLSGVVFPLDKLPSPYREWLLLNPLAHGVDAARHGFAPFYRAFPETSLLYLHAWGIGLVFLGLAVHKRYALRLVTR